MCWIGGLPCLIDVCRESGQSASSRDFCKQMVQLPPFHFPHGLMAIWHGSTGKAELRSEVQVSAAAANLRASSESRWSYWYMKWDLPDFILRGIYAGLSTVYSQVTSERFSVWYVLPLPELEVFKDEVCRNETSRNVYFVWKKKVGRILYGADVAQLVEHYNKLSIDTSFNLLRIFIIIIMIILPLLNYYKFE